jgi:hypothetical protein
MERCVESPALEPPQRREKPTRRPPRPDRAECSRRGCAYPGIMLLMYNFHRLVVLVYIRQSQQHRGGEERRAGARLCESCSDPMREAGESSTGQIEM